MKTGLLAVVAAMTMVSPVATSGALAQRADYQRGDDQRGDYRWQDDNGRDWEPSDHYRDGKYRERRLGRDDRVYRGRDGRAYCKRNDGTTGLVVGAVGGGVLGNLIGGGTLGTLLGAGGGAVLGRSVDRGKVRCR